MLMKIVNNKNAKQVYPQMLPVNTPKIFYLRDPETIRQKDARGEPIAAIVAVLRNHGNNGHPFVRFAFSAANHGDCFCKDRAKKVAHIRLDDNMLTREKAPRHSGTIKFGEMMSDQDSYFDLYPVSYIPQTGHQLMKLVLKYMANDANAFALRIKNFAATAYENLLAHDEADLHPLTTAMNGEEILRPRMFSNGTYRSTSDDERATQTNAIPPPANTNLHSYDFVQAQKDAQENSVAIKVLALFRERDQLVNLLESDVLNQKRVEGIRLELTSVKKDILETMKSF